MLNHRNVIQFATPRDFAAMGERDPNDITIETGYRSVRDWRGWSAPQTLPQPGISIGEPLADQVESRMLPRLRGVAID